MMHRILLLILSFFLCNILSAQFKQNDTLFFVRELNDSLYHRVFIDTNKKGDRLPIFDSKNISRYIIHESTINEFVRKLSTGKYPALKDKKLEEITLEMMVNSTDDEMKNKLTKSQVFVSKNATLFEAKEKMANNQWSQDVFVTETGNATESVIGWITNNKIAELAKV